MTGCRRVRRALPAVLAALAAAAPAPGEPFLADVTAESGVTFVHANGAAGDKNYRETMGSGVAMLDFDGDGRLDLYFVSSLGANRLWRNLGGMRFEEVEAAAGAADDGYGMGATAADLDGDGDTDLLVTNLGPNRLWRNDGGRFSAVEAGVEDPRWGCGAAVLDADGDGRLDLYVANYVEVAHPDTNECWSADRKLRLVCSPRDYPPAPDVFLLNRGGLLFEDATAAAGLAVPPGRGLGAVSLDFDRDGLPDLYVANDLDPNFLFRNTGAGTFEEVGFPAGVSLSEDGREESGMGVAAGDYDGDGWTDLFVTNYVNQTNTLYHNEGGAFFLDQSALSGLGPGSVPWVGWGTEFLDYDGDGWRDLVVVNGHVEPDAEKAYPGNAWRQPDALYRNRGDGTFEDVTAEAAPALLEPHAGRGAAAGDLDDDGDPDLVVVNQNGPARIFENRGPAPPWIGVVLVGHGGNRDGIGARVEVAAGGRVQVAERRAGGSFLSSPDPRLLFRTGTAARVDSVTVIWPSGRRDVVRAPAARRYMTVAESDG